LQKILAKKISGWITLQLLLQLGILAIYAVMTMLKGIEFFGRFAVYQSMISIGAVLIGYRQDIRILDSKPRRSAADHWGCIQPSLVLGGILVFVSLCISLITESGTVLWLTLAAMLLALLESLIAAIFLEQKLVICSLLRLSLPIAALLICLLVPGIDPLWVVFLPILLVLFLSWVIVRQSKSSIHVARISFQALKDKYRKDFFPTITALMLVATANFPVILIDRNYGATYAGTVALLIKFSGSPLSLALSSASSVAIREGVYSSLDLLGIVKNKRFAFAILALTIAFMLLISALVITLGWTADIIAYIFILLTLVIRVSFHALQGIFQVQDNGPLLTKALCLELGILGALYYWAVQHSLVAFSGALLFSAALAAAYFLWMTRRK
jgi:hypothetical protein